MLREKGIKSLAGAPLQVGPELVGVIHVGSRSPAHFNEDDVELLRLVGSAIEQSRFYEKEHERREKAECANRLKDDFVATVSHELRTPLQAIAGWANILKSGRPLDDANRKRGLETIQQNVGLQLRLIEDLLDVTRLATGKLRLNPRIVELPMIVDAAMESVRAAAITKIISLDVNIDREAIFVWGDADRLQQVIWNVLSNAIKFTDKGGQVETVVEKNTPYATIFIRDSGRGIAADFLPHIFERFTQARDATVKEVGGLGLGLAIVKDIVEMHGGTIHVESGGPDRGTTVAIRLPLSCKSEAVSTSAVSLKVQ
jgi:signal transduction histidine kinase